MAKFFCQECGFESFKWFGRCPGCSRFNTLVEEPLSCSTSYLPSWNMPPTSLKSLEIKEKERLITGIEEFDRVLGGGVVPGSLVLLGGDPGIGKSTLLLQVANSLSLNYGSVLYVSAEESPHQIKRRFERIKASSENIYILSQTDLSYVLEQIERLSPKVVIVDSIQTIYWPQLSGSAGSVGQVRECTGYLMQLAKTKDLPIFVIGHVTKEGTIAGPRVLEHIVDTVLYFEGDLHYQYRILRSVKNRFGSTNEIGVFEMVDRGLIEVKNPSSLFLSQRALNSPGSVVVSCIEGTRPILVELQALVSQSKYTLPKREVIGVDYNRVLLLLAVLEKKVGLHLGESDVFVNVAGGFKFGEPALDLGIATAIASSLLESPVPPSFVLIGEVGLAGEVRAVNFIEPRIEEAAKLGFSKCIVPKYNELSGSAKSSIPIERVETLFESLKKINIL